MLICKKIDALSAKLLPLWDITARLIVARIFWKSGLTKIDDWDATIWLFKKEYGMTFMPTLMAYLGTGTELIAPVMLLFGIGTRLAALALFCLSIVVHITYPSFHEHYFWMLVCSAIALRGPEMFSIDYWWCKKKG